MTMKFNSQIFKICVDVYFIKQDYNQFFNKTQFKYHYIINNYKLLHHECPLNIQSSHTGHTDEKQLPALNSINNNQNQVCIGSLLIPKSPNYIHELKYWGNNCSLIMNAGTKCQPKKKLLGHQKQYYMLRTKFLIYRLFPIY